VARGAAGANAAAAAIIAAAMRAGTAAVMTKVVMADATNYL
jgi:hypothetical protein